MSRSTNLGTLTCLFAAAATLAACGGGDDAPAPPPVAAYTQADVLTVAKLGALTVGISQLRVPFMVGHFGGVLLVESTDNGGTGPFSVACPGGGTRSGTITKSAARVGYAVGDSITTAYANCVSAGFTFNGTATLTARSPMANLSTVIFSVDYTADMTNFSVSSGSATTVHNGRIDAIFASPNGDAFTTSFQVPASATYGNLTSGFSVLFAAGSTFAETDTVSTTSGTLATNGAVTVSAGTTPIPLQLSTGPSLSGPLSATVLAMTSGTLNTKDTVLNLTTSTVFSASAATVSGDTDQNGSLDLTFPSSWTALTN